MKKGQHDHRREEILQILSVRLRRILEYADIDYAHLQEIRIRIGAPLMILYRGEEYFVTEKGGLASHPADAHTVTLAELRETMEFVSNYSLYAFEEELRHGFVTIQGGHRVGVAGKMIVERNQIKSIRHISFLNIRLAHQVLGCADRLLPYVRRGDSLYHTLIISPPRCGKTTLLRDMIRQLSNGGNGCKGMTVGVVDERSELGACYLGRPQNDLGCRTDILDCCPKEEGMMMLVRSMAPKVIAVDEIGSRSDVEALEYVMNCGVRVVATVHGDSMEDIENKPVMGRLVKERIFQRYVLLGGQAGKIQAVFDERGSCLAWEKDFAGMGGRVC